MIDVRHFVDELIRQDANVFTGIPCSYLTPLIHEVIARKETRYVLASSEGDALAIASGIWLAGGMGVVFCQNSGLGNMVNPLTSMNEPFGIPALLLVTWRGKPGVKDEPQHKRMGEITPELLSLIGVEWELLPQEEGTALEVLKRACNFIRRVQRPYALVMSRSTFTSDEDIAIPSSNYPSRSEALAAFLDNVDAGAVVIATTGKTGRELFTLDDRCGHFYCVGSMGYASSVAHGIALGSKRRVYLLDGDGAAIMHMGNLTSIGSSHPANLIHIVLDNGCYDSTGAQPTASTSVDFVALALAVGYAQAQSCRSQGDFVLALRSHLPGTGPRLLHVPIRMGSMSQLGRPTTTPYDVARRLRELLMEDHHDIRANTPSEEIQAGASYAPRYLRDREPLTS